MDKVSLIGSVDALIDGYVDDYSRVDVEHIVASVEAPSQATAVVREYAFRVGELYVAAFDSVSRNEDSISGLGLVIGSAGLAIIGGLTARLLDADSASYVAVAAATGLVSESFLRPVSNLLSSAYEKYELMKCDALRDGFRKDALAQLEAIENLDVVR